ncbi:phosphoribosylformylglycinamidine synthase II [Candidatus Peregrinibacteria bacterium RIFOXYA12_FULL_33_12]|nr:MAG: phosphoribosylformylglycinamidine synthase II [Candidatus Peregrinibacteria bacterium RIFOXYA12_FULL_33_12]
MNSTIEDIRTGMPKTLILSGQTGEIKIIPIRDMTDEELMKLSKNTLFLTLEEMHTIKNYFQELGRDPYDAELEILAQTWSEHCCHKTFNAKLVIDGVEKESLFKRLKNATKEINHSHAVSIFVDNSGVWKFDDKYGICGKVETHNSPSALDPFGGAATGSGGVFRDIAGTGQGAKVIASTDMFCVGLPDCPESEIPEGCKHPRFTLKGVVRGVSYYGNPMGIPTPNGSVHFHHDFRCKPSIIVGSYGLIELDKAIKKAPNFGDLIFVIGGRTGRDGIHGATFSSAEMTAETATVNSTAVQIGNPIEEKRTFDAVLELSKENMIHAVTDCGAGGFSSAIGEMGEKTGAYVELEKAPLKYTGLAPWEIFISESQERMVVALDPQNLDKAKKICEKYSVESTVLGKFTGDNKLLVTYEDKTLCDLPMEFVHKGLNPLVIKGNYVVSSFPDPSENEVSKDDYTESLHKILSNLNVCSKEPIIRRYDHNVQGTAVQMPLCGKTHSAPNNASVLEPIPGCGKGLIISHGLNPVLNKIDPYLGSKWAINEAIANAVCQGANPENLALIDNFIWPKPDSKFIADLDKSIEACVELSKAYKMPFISGKDSLSSTYTNQATGEKIHIPPVLCVSTFGVVDDINKTISSPFKKVGNKIVLIGETRAEMGGSIYYDVLGYVGSKVPDIEKAVAFKTYQAIHKGIQNGLIKSCADISEGGLAGCVTEMAFGEMFGVEIELRIENRDLKNFEYLFSESPCRFVGEVAEHDFENLKQICGDIPCEIIGEINNNGQIIFKDKDKILIQEKTDKLFKSWKEPMKKVFG